MVFSGALLAGWPGGAMSGARRGSAARSPGPVRDSSAVRRAFRAAPPWHGPLGSFPAEGARGLEHASSADRSGRLHRRSLSFGRSIEDGRSQSAGDLGYPAPASGASNLPAGKCQEGRESRVRGSEGEEKEHGEERPPSTAGRGRMPRRGPRSLVRPGLYFYGGMGIVALLWRMSTPGESILHPSVEAEARAWSVPAAIAVGAAAGLAAVAVSELLTRLTRLGRSLSE